MSQRKPWWQHEASIAWALILFFPLGLLLMWKYAPWRNRFKWGWTIALPLLTLFILAAAIPDPEQTGQEQQARTISTLTPPSTAQEPFPPTSTPNPIPPPEPSPAPSPTIAPTSDQLLPSEWIAFVLTWVIEVGDDSTTIWDTLHQYEANPLLLRDLPIRAQMLDAFSQFRAARAAYTATQPPEQYAEIHALQLAAYEKMEACADKVDQMYRAWDSGDTFSATIFLHEAENLMTEAITTMDRGAALFDTAGPPADAPTSAPPNGPHPQDISTYIALAREWGGKSAVALDTIGAIFIQYGSNLSLVDDTTLRDQVAQAFSVIDSARTVLSATQPPEALRETHSLLMAAYEKLDGASNQVDKIYLAWDQGDLASVSSAAAEAGILLRDAGLLIEQATMALMEAQP